MMRGKTIGMESIWGGQICEGWGKLTVAGRVGRSLVSLLNAVDYEGGDDSQCYHPTQHAAQISPGSLLGAPMW